jgi:hypothetical protein
MYPISTDDPYGIKRLESRKPKPLPLLSGWIDFADELTAVMDHLQVKTQFP